MNKIPDKENNRIKRIFGDEQGDPSRTASMLSKFIQPPTNSFNVVTYPGGPLHGSFSTTVHNFMFLESFVGFLTNFMRVPAEIGYGLRKDGTLAHVEFVLEVRLRDAVLTERVVCKYTDFSELLHRLYGGSEDRFILHSREECSLKIIKSILHLIESNVN